MSYRPCVCLSICRIDAHLPANCQGQVQGLFFQCASQRHQYFFGLLRCKYRAIAGLTLRSRRTAHHLLPDVNSLCRTARQFRRPLFQKTPFFLHLNANSKANSVPRGGIPRRTTGVKRVGGRHCRWHIRLVTIRLAPGRDIQRQRRELDARQRSIKSEASAGESETAVVRRH